MQGKRLGFLLLLCLGRVLGALIVHGASHKRQAGAKAMPRSINGLSTKQVLNAACAQLGLFLVGDGVICVL